MSRRTAPDSDPAEALTRHEMVQDLERSIAARISADASSRDEVTRAQAEADALMVQARDRAAEIGRAHADAILTMARAEAARLVEAGARAAADLSAAAARQRDDDLATVLHRVLPGMVAD